MKLSKLILLLQYVKDHKTTKSNPDPEVILACDEEGNGFAGVEGYEKVTFGEHKGKIILWPGSDQFLLD